MIFIQIIILLIVLGIIWKFLLPYIADPFQAIIQVLIILGFCVWLLDKFDIIHTNVFR